MFANFEKSNQNQNHTTHHAS
jgi:hypothetical protein